VFSMKAGQTYTYGNTPHICRIRATSPFGRTNKMNEKPTKTAL